jgi:diacylglycerol kinase (ATP)
LLRRKRPQDSFRFAGEGILHCFRTQRNMQLHFAMLILVLVSGLLLALDTMRMLVLLFCISLVIATEMVNTAVEAIVDMVTQTYHPLAKLAKDVAAGAVLIASANAVIAGCLIFFGSEPIRKIGTGVDLPKNAPDVTVVFVVGILVLVAGVIMSKLLTGRANTGLLKGGVISGHSAVGFFLAVTIIYCSGNQFVAILALLMAAIIAQSRVEAGIHSLQEVLLGAVLAIFLTSSVYWLMPRVRAQLRQTAPATAVRTGRVAPAERSLAPNAPIVSRAQEGGVGSHV